MPSRWGTREDRYTPKERAAILERDGYVCQIQYSGCLGAATIVDHRIQLSLLPPGAGRDPDLGQAACRPCHDRKTKAETGTARRSSWDRRMARRKLPKPDKHPGDP
jgi:5-methylcytosine-specific restriction endonuclease McrA